MDVTLEGLCIGSNALSSGLAWGPSELLAYAAGCLVALWDPKANPQHGVLATLKGHTARARLITLHQGGQKYLISGAADKTVKIWSVCLDENRRSVSWKCLHSLAGHDASVIGLATVIEGKELTATTFASCDSLGRLLMWRFEDGGPRCIQKIEHRANYPLCLSLAHLPGSKSRVLLTGNTDKKIHFWVEKGEEFAHVLALSGHADWVRSVDSIEAPGLLYVASGSQDRYVRIWRIQHDVAGKPTTENMRDSSVDEVDAVDEEEDADEVGTIRQPSVKSFKFVTHADGQDLVFTVQLETVIPAHDDWISSVCWAQNGQTAPGAVLSLITSSADKTVALWRPDLDGSGLWSTRVKLGIAGGAASNGFTNAAIDSSASVIVGNGQNGSLHVWRLDVAQDEWLPTPGVSGHFRPVQSLAWDPREGTFLLTTSKDQTTRMFTHVCGSGFDALVEISRPQIHGYDLNCLTPLTSNQFASGAEEKIVRVFECPPLVRNLLDAAKSGDASSKPLTISGTYVPVTLPALGLSNKAGAETNNDDSDTLQLREANLGVPPLEENLQQQTLWPEINKLYGHGYEITAMGASGDGKLLATASKATQADHAMIRVWDTSSWTEAQAPLAGHSLTVTCIRFSHSDEWLLTAGRDRSWALFRRDGSTFVPVVRREKAHSRIIWDATWTCDDKFFATGSRDKTVKIYAMPGNGAAAPEEIASITLPEAVTTLDFADQVNCDALGAYLLAIGLENGEIVIFSAKRSDPGGWMQAAAADFKLSHFGPVSKLRWRPGRLSQPRTLQLGSAGEDHSVRTFAVEVK